MGWPRISALGVAEDASRAAIPADDQAGAVRRHDRVVGGIGERPIPGFAGPDADVGAVIKQRHLDHGAQILFVERLDAVAEGLGFLGAIQRFAAREGGDKHDHSGEPPPDGARRGDPSIGPARLASIRIKSGLSRSTSSLASSPLRVWAIGS